MQYCSLQHQTLLPSPVTSITEGCFCFGSVSSFFLELFLHWSPVVYWAPTNLGSSSFSVLSFHLFILFMGFSRQEYWVVCHFLLQWTTFCQNSPPWPVRLGWPCTACLIAPLSFTRLPMWSVSIILVSYPKEWSNAICSNMDGPRECHTKWSKSYWEGEILYNTLYMWNLKRNHTNKLTYKTERDSVT